MSVIDIAILVLLGGFILAGFWFGLIHMVGALVGLFVGVAVAGHYYAGVAAWLSPLIGDNLSLASILSFLFLFLLTGKLFGLLLSLIDKVFKIIAIIPFTKTINRLLGAAFGLLEGTLYLSVAVYFISRFPVSVAFDLLLQNSPFIRPLALIGSLFSPLLPEAVRLLNSVI
ncbi:MAG: CvpA family protein [Patescibacteria group bacterium]|jgi:uncharacterized membrane protein required for colicin V production